MRRWRNDLRPRKSPVRSDKWFHKTSKPKNHLGSHQRECSPSKALDEDYFMQNAKGGINPSD